MQKCLRRRPYLDFSSLPWPERRQWVLVQLQNLGSSGQSESAGVSFKMQEKKLFPFLFQYPSRCIIKICICYLMLHSLGYRDTSTYVQVSPQGSAFPPRLPMGCMCSSLVLPAPCIDPYWGQRTHVREARRWGDVGPPLSVGPRPQCVVHYLMELHLQNTKKKNSKHFRNFFLAF